MLTSYFEAPSAGYYSKYKALLKASHRYSEHIWHSQLLPINYLHKTVSVMKA